jgi:hypothetical protein
MASFSVPPDARYAYLYVVLPGRIKQKVCGDAIVLLQLEQYAAARFAFAAIALQIEVQALME